MLHQCFHNDAKERESIQRFFPTTLHSVSHRVEEPREIKSSHKFILLNLIASSGTYAKCMIYRYYCLATIA